MHKDKVRPDLSDRDGFLTPAIGLLTALLSPGFSPTAARAVVLKCKPNGVLLPLKSAQWAPMDFRIESN